jgi:hypothetical protein
MKRSDTGVNSLFLRVNRSAELANSPRALRGLALICQKNINILFRTDQSGERRDRNVCQFLISLPSTCI